MQMRRSNSRGFAWIACVAGLALSGSALAHGATAGPAMGHIAVAGLSHDGGHAQGYLGVDIRDVSADQMIALRLKEQRGAEIIRVDHDGPAGKAGLREHDVILQMNGKQIE